MSFGGFGPFVVQNISPLMPADLPPCPHLPAPRAGLDWRTLHIHRGDVRGGNFYHDCLEYAHALWHLCVLAGSICHFFCMLLYVLPD